MPKLSTIQKTRFSGGINDSTNPMEVRSDQLSDAENVVPRGSSVMRRHGLHNSPATQSLTARCNGLSQMRTKEGAVWRFGIFGDKKCYYLVNETWAELDTSGSAITNSSAPWAGVDTIISGNDALILTNYEDVPKKITAPSAASIVVLDECEETTGWSAAAEPADAIVLNGANKTRGLYSLGMGTSAFTVVNPCDSIISPVVESMEAAISARLDTTTFRQGTASINMGKLAHATKTTAVYTSTNAAVVNCTSTAKHAYMNLYLSSAAIDVLKTTGAVELKILADTSGKAYTKTYDKSAFSTAGWYLLGGVLTGWTADSGASITSVKGFKITITTTNSTDAIALGDAKMDYWFIVEDPTTISYSKTLTIPVDCHLKTQYKTDVYIDDVLYLDSTAAIKIYLGSDSSNYDHKTWARSSLISGWNTLTMTFSGGGKDTTTVGSPDTNNIDYLKIEFKSNMTVGGATATPGYGVIPAGLLLMDYWRADTTSSGLPTWAALGGTPPRAKYIAQYQNYYFLGNIKANASETDIYPARVIRSKLLAPETWDAGNTYDMGNEAGYPITGMVVANDRLCVFRERGIFELAYTGNASLPFTRRQTHASLGAFHNTVVACGPGQPVMFATNAGVYGYWPGSGQVAETPMSKDITNTYRALVVDSGRKDVLRAAYNPDLNQYWLACGATANDTILIYDFIENSWWKWTSDITGFDITSMANTSDGGYIMPVLGMATGHVVGYSPALDQYWDEQQAGTAVAIASYFTTNYFHWNNPGYDKRLVRGNVWGHAEGSNTLAVSIIPDGKDAVSLGTFNFYSAANGLTEQRFHVPPAAGRGAMFRMKLSETGSTSADSTYRVDSITYAGMMMGIR